MPLFCKFFYVGQVSWVALQPKQYTFWAELLSSQSSSQDKTNFYDFLTAPVTRIHSIFVFSVIHINLAFPKYLHPFYYYVFTYSISQPLKILLNSPPSVKQSVRLQLLFTSVLYKFGKLPQNAFLQLFVYAELYFPPIIHL